MTELGSQPRLSKFRPRGFDPELEKSGVLQPCDDSTDMSHFDNASQRRPPDVFLPRWRAGNTAAFEFVITANSRTLLSSTSIKYVYHNSQRRRPRCNVFSKIGFPLNSAINAA